MKEEARRWKSSREGGVDKIRIAKFKDSLGDEQCNRGRRCRDKDVTELNNMMHNDGNNEGQHEPESLDAHMVNQRSRRSRGGKATMDLASFQSGGYWDDTKGGRLEPKLVLAARSEEL